MAHQLYVLQCQLFALLHEKRQTPVDPADQVCAGLYTQCIHTAPTVNQSHTQYGLRGSNALWFNVLILVLYKSFVCVFT